MQSPEYTPTVSHFIRHVAERFATNELIVQGDQRMSYADAEAESARMARALIQAGVGKGTHIGLLLPNGPDWVVAWLAATRIGAVAVPLNTFFKVRELAWILKHADVEVLLATATFLNNDYVERLEQAAPSLAEARDPRLRLPELPLLRSVYLSGECDRGWARNADELRAESNIDEAFLREVESCVTPSDPMVILYSSGSTADPKGAVHTHASILLHSYQLALHRDLKPDDRAYSPMPFFWVGGFVYAFLTTVQKGACALCEEVFDPETTLAFLEKERASLAVGWPHFGKALAEHPSRAERDLSALRAGNLPDLFPPEVVSPDPELRANALGMTETCGPHTWGGESILPESRRGTFGTPLDGIEHKVVDPGTGQRLAQGELGEICVRGYSLMQRLYKVDREDTFDADGYYHTGDAGYFDEQGELYFKGRLGDMIKSGGANVTPSEVETVLDGYPEVKQAYVVGVPDAERGQLVTAAVVLSAGASIEAEALRQRLKGDLSAYKVPRHLFLYSNEELPFTDTGKIQKGRLSELLAKRIAG